MRSLPVKMHVANVPSKSERYLGESLQKGTGGGGGVPQSKGSSLVLSVENVDKLMLHLDEVAARKKARQVEALLQRHPTATSADTFLHAPALRAKIGAKAKHAPNLLGAQRIGAKTTAATFVNSLSPIGTEARHSFEPRLVVAPLVCVCERERERARVYVCFRQDRRESLARQAYDPLDLATLLHSQT